VKWIFVLSLIIVLGRARISRRPLLFVLAP